MQIHSVSLLGSGVKGAEVHFMREDRRNDIGFKNEHKAKYRYPVPASLRQLFIELEPFAIKLLQLKKDTMVTVTKVISNEESFQLVVDVVSVGSRHYTATTPYVDADIAGEFPEYDKVIAKIGTIYDETEVYINNNREEKINYQQMAMEFAEVDAKAAKLVSKVELESMSEEEQRELCMTILQNQGAIVLVPEEHETAEDRNSDF